MQFFINKPAFYDNSLAKKMMMIILLCVKKHFLNSIKSSISNNFHLFRQLKFRFREEKFHNFKHDSRATGGKNCKCTLPRVASFNFLIGFEIWKATWNVHKYLHKVINKSVKLCATAITCVWKLRLKLNFIQHFKK